MRGRDILVSAQAGLPLLELVRVREAKLSADRARARAIYPFGAVGGLPHDPAVGFFSGRPEALRPALWCRRRAADALPPGVRGIRAAFARRPRARDETWREAREGPTGCVIRCKQITPGFVLASLSSVLLVHFELYVQLDERRAGSVLEVNDARVDDLDRLEGSEVRGLPRQREVCGEL